MSPCAKILFVLTSAASKGEGGPPTGFYYEELTTPYWAFVEAGFAVDLASIKGGEPPHDPASLPEPGRRLRSVERFLSDPTARAQLERTACIERIDARAYDALVLPGGHGTMWDLAQDDTLARLVARMFDASKLIAAVCHGPAGLVSARRADGRAVIAGRRVTCFTNAEEAAAGLTASTPFLLESRLHALGGRVSAGADFQPHVVRDGNLITGQNPASSQGLADKVVEALAQYRQAVAL